MEAMTFSALGEPSRLQIVELLRGGPSSVGEIADRVGIRQPQASKHLRVLAQAGIVVGERVAKRRVYRLEATPFDELERWLGSFERLWEGRLDALGAVLDSMGTDGSTDGNEDR